MENWWERTEDAFVVDLFDDKPRAGREHADENVQVKEERDPRRRLVLRHRRNNRNVNFGITSVP